MSPLIPLLIVLTPKTRVRTNSNGARRVLMTPSRNMAWRPSYHQGPSFGLVEPITEHVDVAAGGAGVLLDGDLVLGDQLGADDEGPVAPAVDAVGAGAAAHAGVLAVDVELDLVIAVDVVHAPDDGDRLARD